ncbi:hypothetical protein CBR_g57965 [Chara braunii]|uniref:Jacalin-type lectin domain-containing protein n=1 Tax=Chara braunii TaxID=69332 RepID=A0A388MEI4_CHABU|nr:hypothetical protein CBR_g57965 [Chara braunii]|eukprot:GBG92967.1 hypothetical protein CBR_g57965 [Chara braunii]
MPCYSHSMTAIAVWLAMSVVAHIDAQDAPPDVSIRGVSFKGTGCDGANTVYDVSVDKKAVTFIFRNFTAILGVRHKSDCEIQLQLESTDGWQLERAETIGRGYADLGAGVVGRHTLTSSISGLTFDSKASKRITEIRGPFTDNYDVSEKFLRLGTYCAAVGSMESMDSPACAVENAVNIKSLLKVKGPKGAKGIMNVDSQDTALTIKCVWEAC